MSTRREPPRRRTSIQEYESAELADEELTARDLDVLQTLGQSDLLSLRRLRGSWEIHAKAVVGLLTLDHTVLEIRPKTMVSGEQVMAWIRYALALPTHVELPRGWSTAPSGLRDLVIAALVAECRVLLRDQLRRDYRRHDSVEPVLRGRLDIAAQISRRFGQVDRLHVRTFDRDVAIWENLACHAALTRAARVAESVELARAAHDVAAGFPPCRADRRTVLRWLATARYHRMNQRYRAAHTWAALLLGGGGVSDLLAEGSERAESLLINMNRLWEAVVRRLSEQAVEGHGGSLASATGEQAIVVHEQDRGTRSLRPDVLLQLRADDPSLLAVDAKYKRYDEHVVDSADVHQLLTYAHEYQAPDGLRRAVIVHPSGLGSTQRTITVRGPSGHLGTVDIVGLDVGQPPPECVAKLSQALPQTVGP
ncbi:MAG: PE-PGRS family protein [Pseudonocardiaceae bacterium]|nr:PE-PGRS family protein [Pseudonocardiaceae bacterium]